jgi:ADP-ribose pyrophosphatase
MKKVSIEQKRYLLNDFFKVEEAYLRFEQFNGEMSRQLRRLSLERGDSVAILVYNLTTEKIILINQFRYPTYQHGDGWITETIAGIMDHKEEPEQTAQREIREQTGLNINSFEQIATFYPSPGGSSERVFLYYSEVSGKESKDKATGGMLREGEDIKVIELSVADALIKIRSGEIMDAKTILGIYWLENRLMKKQQQSQEDSAGR